MLEELVPAEVRVVEAFADLPDVMLSQEEELVISKAVETRRREFRTTRACAKAALIELGWPPDPIPAGARGAPQWPKGVVGSMTHCRGYRAAAVATRKAFLSIGVDAEPHAPLPSGVLGAIALSVEQRRLDNLAAHSVEICWDRLLFSAKESVYKAWFPLAQKMLDFSQADIVIDPAGVFTARLLVDGPVVDGVPINGFTGRWLARDGLVLTAIIIEAG